MANRESFQQSDRLEALDEAACFALLRDGTVGRIAFSDAKGLQIIPVNYVLAGRMIFFRTARGTALAQLASGQHDVAFEVDYHDDDKAAGWSVLIKGSATAINAERVRALVTDQTLVPLPGGERSLYLQLEPIVVTGRRVRRVAGR